MNVVNEKKTDDKETFEKLLAEPETGARYVLRLFVTGMTPRSLDAIATIKALCKERLQNYDLEVVDIYQQPALAIDEQIIALPTLIKKEPPPLRRMIGNLSDRDRLLSGLNLRPKS